MINNDKLKVKILLKTKVLKIMNNKSIIHGKT